jgi:hypothetical protein
MKKFLTYGAGLIALYLVVQNASNSGKVITNGAAGGRSIITAFQGR